MKVKRKIDPNHLLESYLEDHIESMRSFICLFKKQGMSKENFDIVMKSMKKEFYEFWEAN